MGLVDLSLPLVNSKLLIKIRKPNETGLRTSLDEEILFCHLRVQDRLCFSIENQVLNTRASINSFELIQGPNIQAR